MIRLGPNSVEVTPCVTVAKSDMMNVIANQKGKCVSVIHGRPVADLEGFKECDPPPPPKGSNYFNFIGKLLKKIR